MEINGFREKNQTKENNYDKVEVKLEFLRLSNSENYIPQYQGLKQIF